MEWSEAADGTELRHGRITGWCWKARLSMTFGKTGLSTTIPRTDATASVYGIRTADRITLRNAGKQYGHRSARCDRTARECRFDIAIADAVAEVAKYGAYINRLEYASDNLLNVAQNTDASRSRIEDADYAEETSELGKDTNHCTGGHCDARPGESDQADSVWHCCSNGVRNGGPDWNEIDSNYLI